MIKRLTLEEAWEYCLEMWKWIAEVVAQRQEEDKGWSVEGLKVRWLENHPQFVSGVDEDCFFCEYAKQNEYCGLSCPGKLVSKEFSCMELAYYYYSEPIKFYQELLELAEIRKKQKKKI